MKKTFEYIIIVLGLFITFNIIFTTNVEANTINSVNMDIFIDSNGNANVTEIWKVYTNTGTEGYKSYSDLGKSTISNFSVTDDTGTLYTTLSVWNANGTLSSKAYKCGINQTSDGLELCWGISEYGNRTYTLKYTINNLVTQYNDAQGIYFNFLNLNQSIGNATIKIYSDISFSLDNARIWAFGNNGNINFADGKIVLKSDGQLSSTQYMVGLIRFEENLFNTNSKSSDSFDSIYDSALDSVSNNSHDSLKKISKIIAYICLVGIAILCFYIVYHLFQILFDVIVKSFKLSPIFTTIIILINIFLPFESIILRGLFILFSFIIVVVVHQNKLLIKKSKFNKPLPTLRNSNQIVKSLGDVNYWREIPFNENIWCTALAAEFFYDFNYKDSYLIGAILLKWIKNNNIGVRETKKGLFNIKDNNYAISFNSAKDLSPIELSLWNILKSASGINNILEANELKSWCMKHYDKMVNWFYSCKIYAQNEAKKLGFISKDKCATLEFKEEAKKLLGLKRFLINYSLLSEKDYFNVHLWENYLIFAELLGIADKVEEQFSKIYPSFNQMSKLNTDISTLAIRNLAEITYKSINDGRLKACRDLDKYDFKNINSHNHDYSGKDRDRGGGGSSYSDGGKSAGGSSGGGFR